MIEIPINNQQTIEIIQDKQKDAIVVTTKASNGYINCRYIIEEGDMVMLLNYFRYCKENDKAIL